MKHVILNCKLLVQTPEADGVANANFFFHMELRGYAHIAAQGIKLCLYSEQLAFNTARSAGLTFLLLQVQELLVRGRILE